MNESEIRDWLVANMNGTGLALCINAGKPGVLFKSPEGEGIFLLWVERSSMAAVQSILSAQEATHA